MKGSTEQNQIPQKKPYRKPEVKEVQLRPEEAVLGNCKVSGGAGPDGGNCTGLVLGYCVSSGS